MQRSVILVVLVAFLVAGCGGSDDADPAPSITSSTLSTTEPPATTAARSTTSAPSTTAGPDATTTTAPATTAQPAETTTTTSTSTTTTTTTTTTEAPGPTRISVAVTGGTVDGEEHVTVKRGTDVEITVTADSADEVHVHGYDYKAAVAPGSPAVILFLADLPGIYEVELEDAGTLLLELEVR